MAVKDSDSGYTMEIFFSIPDIKLETGNSGQTIRFEWSRLAKGVLEFSSHEWPWAPPRLAAKGNDQPAEWDFWIGRI